MTRAFSTSADHLDSSVVAATAVPLTLSIWYNKTNGINHRFLQLCHPTDLLNFFCLGTDTSASNGQIAMSRGNGSVTNQARTTVAGTASTWCHAIGVCSAANAAAVYLNGGNKATSSTSMTPSGIAKTIISGRASDHTSGINGQGAHAAVWTRAISDLEAQHLGTGGHPRSLAGLVSYWKIVAASGTETDAVGTNGLTVTGTGSKSSDPDVASHFTGAAIGAQSYANGSAIASIDVGARFDDVSSAFTVTLKQLASPTQPTTTSGSGTAAREVLVGDASTYSAGDYMKITSGGTPTRVLAISGNTLLVADNQTWSAAANVYRYGVNSKTITGCSITSNVFSGTPTSSATDALCFFRAACNNNAALIADSDLFTVTVASGTPTFTAGPTVAPTTTGYTLSFTPSASATFYMVAMLRGSAAPTAAQVITGSPTGFLARVSKAVTGADSASFTTLTFPLADIYAVLDNGGGTSGVFSAVNQLKSPPTGKQYGILSASLSATSPFLIVSPPTVSGDVFIIPLLTPSSYAITLTSTGDAIVTASSDQARQLVGFNVYDVSAGDFYYSADSTLSINNKQPDFPGDDTAAFVVIFPKNASVTPFALSSIGVVDAEADTLSYAETTSVLAGKGLSINGSMQIVGTTPNANSVTSLGISVSDGFGGLLLLTGSLVIGTVAVPDVSVAGTLTSDAQDTISAALLVPVIVNVMSATVPAGQVVSQSPAAATQVNPGSVVTIFNSLGSSAALPAATASAPAAVAHGAALATGTVAVATASAPTGPAFASASTPNIVGSTQASAATAIAAAGFVTGNVSFAYSASVALGLVVSQSPAAGTTQTFGTLINFVVSLGPQPSGPPAPTPGIFPANISGLTFSGARRKGWGTQLQESLTTKFTSIGLQKFPIVYWELNYELVRDDISPSELRSLLGLTNAQQGRAGRFLYVDPLFNTVALEPFGTGNGTTTAFQLVATFQNPGGPGRPEIIQNLNGAPQIFDNGSLVSSGAYSIGVTGIVTFTTPPTNGHALTWSGSFYYRCKFVADTQDFEMLMKQWWTAKSIKFRSVIL